MFHLIWAIKFIVIFILSVIEYNYSKSKLKITLHNTAFWKILNERKSNTQDTSLKRMRPSYKVAKM